MSRPKIAQWVKDLTEDVMGGSPLVIGRIYRHPQDGLIKVTGGQYWGDFGISNFWHWTVVNTGAQHYGYGGNWEEVNE